MSGRPEARFGGQKYPYAIWKLSSWILRGPVDQGAIKGKNINHTESEVDSLKKQLDLIYNNGYHNNSF